MKTFLASLVTLVMLTSRGYAEPSTSSRLHRVLKFLQTLNLGWTGGR